MREATGPTLASLTETSPKCGARPSSPLIRSATPGSDQSPHAFTVESNWYWDADELGHPIRCLETVLARSYPADCREHDRAWAHWTFSSACSGEGGNAPP